MKELNYQTVGDVVYIIVRKSDWSVLFSSEISADAVNYFNLSAGDKRLLVGSSTGAEALIFVLEKILGKMFVLIEKTDEFIYYIRDDIVAKEGLEKFQAQKRR